MNTTRANTTLLLDVLPMTPASLPDVVRVVWTGKSSPTETDSVHSSQFTGRYAPCNGYVRTMRTTNRSPSITDTSRSGRRCSLPLVRSNTPTRTHRFQSSTSNDVAWCSTRPPATGMGGSRHQHLPMSNFRMSLHSPRYSFSDLLTLRNYAWLFLTNYSRS